MGVCTAVPRLRAHASGRPQSTAEPQGCAERPSERLDPSPRERRSLNVVAMFDREFDLFWLDTPARKSKDFGDVGLGLFALTRTSGNASASTPLSGVAAA